MKTKNAVVNFKDDKFCMLHARAKFKNKQKNLVNPSNLVVV